MRHKNSILPVRLGSFRWSTLDYALTTVQWVSNRLYGHRGGRPLAIVETENLTWDAEENLNEHHHGRARAVALWAQIAERWRESLGAEEDDDKLRQLIRDTESWIDHSLPEVERARLLNTLRQARFQKKRSSGARRRYISVQIDRDMYEKAVSMIPAGERSKALTKLLGAFIEDEDLRTRILG